MGEFKPFWEQPSHPDKIEVVKGNKPYKSSAYSKIFLPAGALFTKIAAATFVDHDTYTTLNSDLVYCNHSCNPSLVFDMTRFEVRVSEDRPLSVGDELTHFQCECNAGPGRCLGLIAGAGSIEPSTLKRFWLNKHIHELLDDKRRMMIDKLPQFGEKELSPTPDRADITP
ncbi:uncharacterized protein BDW43DRAFT_304021 [Aspergillus alliaceus]|uniref:uncharacterized protein n=1 Tax=Petromyces alliaceus TaxID=209559 RepID=UPI0012A4CD1D|nr:uncharacterized protein BDW43DRAFT_304021 [Aspergillus alliaceus]KAB8228307.1 hypothetical protein BDW43DRAFT_304021 [Aspergillus alliaceus]